MSTWKAKTKPYNSLYLLKQHGHGVNIVHILKSLSRILPVQWSVITEWKREVVRKFVLIGMILISQQLEEIILQS